MNRLGIEMLTLLGMPPAEHVRLTAELGCASISTGLTSLPMARLGHADLYPAWSLETDLALRRDMKAALKETGVHIALAEGFGVRPGLDIRNRAAALDIMAELGARRVNAISMEPDMARGLDQLAILAGMTAERGMTFIVEFAPSSVLNSLPAALAASDHVGRERCKLMVDSMHFFRSGATLGDLRKLDPARLAYAQLCDVPKVSPGGAYFDEAMFTRLAPGEGELPLAEWIAALPSDLAMGLEVPKLAAVKKSPRDHAAKVVAAARRLGA